MSAAPNGELVTPPTLAIKGGDARVLLALNVEGGRLVATYDPADLDEAARRFIEFVVSTSGGSDA